MGEFDLGVIQRSLPYLWSGMVYTLGLTSLAMVVGIGGGTLLAVARLASFKPLAWLAALYVNLMRSVPLVLVIFWFYFLVPLLVQGLTGAAQPQAISAEQTALVSFSLFEIAFYCEIMRAGIQSIPNGQQSAARAMGLTYWQQLQYVILPQAFRNMLPILLSQTIVLFQDTSLVYVISVTDFLGAAAKIAQRDSRLLELYLFAAVVYFVISLALSRLVRSLQKRMRVAVS
ncbi:MAG: ABC transporter permease subunit [Pseudanabaenaceae cyanobacterium bins.68]|nr:ABC transporter permease subunit [Pseudanabaenaceae cyanobacterium bins.68]